MAKRRAKHRRRMHRQGDLFATAGLFPVRRPDQGAQNLDVKQLRMRAAMTQAITESGQSRDVVAARIAELTGRPLTKDALYTYTAGSKPEHDISLMRFVALVRVTGATWLVDELFGDLGLTVLEGREARLAQLGHLEQEEQRLAKAKRALRRELQLDPVEVTPRRDRR